MLIYLAKKKKLKVHHNYFNFQNEMTFECFCVMPYSKKLQQCNNVFHSLLKRQAKVNQLLNILHHQPKMQEIFENILELNNMLRQTRVNLFKANFSTEHEFHGMKSSPK